MLLAQFQCHFIFLCLSENNVQSGCLWKDWKMVGIKNMPLEFSLWISWLVYEIRHFCKVFTVQKQRNNNVWLPFWKQQQVLSDECYLYGEFRLTGVRGKIDITCRKPECHPQRCLLARQQWVPAAWKSLSSLIANPGQSKAKT